MAKTTKSKSQPKNKPSPGKLSREEAAFLKKLGARIRQVRKSKGHSSAMKFAFTYEIDPSSFNRYEAGANITILSLRKVCNALEISLDELLKDL
jgi:hypothetical protein